VPRFSRGLAAALLLGAIVRWLPLEEWSRRPCVRDECTYRALATNLLRGEGMVGTKGWLWAPGYPAAIAAHARAFGQINDVKITQIVVALLTVVMLWRFTRDHFGARAATIAALLLALNPTHVFYASSLWSECFYTALLFGMVYALGWARGERPGAEPDPGAAVPHPLRALLPGLLLGGCVLFRGVATYLLPCVAVALLWGRARHHRAWGAVGAAALAATLVVAPYSAYASGKFNALVISDRTLGQMMWLGDNDFPPLTFDFGNGPLNDVERDRMTASGRDHCPFESQPAKQDACEVQAGLAWIRANPGEFVARMPLRVAQMVNPHSLLTRNLRTGKWKGLPQWVDEALIGVVVALSFVVLVGGTVGLFARGRGWFAVAGVLIVGYHVAAIACLAGLSRYRVPLEPLWMVYAAGLLAEPRAAWEAFVASRARSVGAVLVAGVLLALMLRFLPTGWRSWSTW
jgi:hypothetical protein